MANSLRRIFISEVPTIGMACEFIYIHDDHSYNIAFIVCIVSLRLRNLIVKIGFVFKEFLNSKSL